MKKLFAKFSGKSESYLGSEVSEKDFVYCLVKVPAYTDIEQVGRFMSVLAKLFKLIEETGGDVNSFCCDILLALYGLPLNDKYLPRHLYDLLVGFSAFDEQLTAVIGKDKGLYGAMGYEKRMVVTALGPRMLCDFRQMNAFQVGKVYIHQEIVQEIRGVEGLRGVEVI